MKKFTLINLFTILFILLDTVSEAQEYTYEDFVGTWHGTIKSPSTSGATIPMTMTMESNGFYTESSGALMPTLYPNTQQCEYQVASNRMHWWYLGTAWGGQYFYDHFFYEVVYFQNDTLEMHYNYWDDPEPHPEVGTIFLVKENLTPPPTALQTEVVDNDIFLTWNEPVLGNGGMANPTNYKVYYKMGESAFELLETTVSNSFTHQNVTAAGSHSYYVIAVYNEGESDSSNQVEVVLTTPEPTNLVSQLLANNVVLNWDQPDNNLPMAGLLGYNIYHRLDAGEYELLMFTEDPYYAHEEIPAGIHSYYVTAVYDGAESDPSNEVMVELIISNVENEIASGTKLYPNPVSNVLNINSEFLIDGVKIYSQTGKVLYQQTLSAKNFRISVIDLPAGLYVVQMETIKGSISKRILVQ
ncbi:MAG: T9SS type A sorting domain-containing protein [Bacteroidetes bacterium]|nr:T9SS type A sorting domain-containing protein [Bacteroidota bacterium]